ncbi:MAG: AAA family ATPase [Proteobacteria bacterium]|nr:AAA family ATPase [Pseudomonadota bacterium]
MTTNPGILSPYRPQPPAPDVSSQVRRPGQLLCPDGIVFDGLERVVRRHLFQLNAAGDVHPRPPRALVITGKPGTGKTVAATDAALRSKHAVLQLPASSLASENEGGATAVFDAYIDDAQRHSQRHHELVVLVADDLDLGIISADASTGRTVNSNLLVQRLQSFADGDDGRNFDGTRIALIVTGNDWSKVRASLFRDGRATWHEHAPAPEDIADFALDLFKPRSEDERRFIRKLARRYRHESIAFWTAVANSMRTDLIDGLLAAGITDPSAVKVELHRPRPLEPSKLFAIARRHAKPRRLSFL